MNGGVWGGGNLRRRRLAVAWRRRARVEVAAADADFYRAVRSGSAAEVWATAVVAEHAAAEHAAAVRAVHAATRAWFAARRDAGPPAGPCARGVCLN